MIKQAEAVVIAERQVERERKEAEERRKNPAKAMAPITEEANQAAALAAAADALILDDKPFDKMTPAEKKLKQLKDLKAKQDKAEKDKRENPTVDANGEHI